jgi:predicted nucleic acid-binding protein
MAVVVSDASPLICLAAIRHFNLLRIFYGEVLIPAVVWQEITRISTFHDLRAKSGSDAEDVQEANDRLAHDDMRTTQVVYRRKPRRARPGRKVGA